MKDVRPRTVTPDRPTRASCRRRGALAPHASSALSDTSGAPSMRSDVQEAPERLAACALKRAVSKRLAVRWHEAAWEVDPRLVLTRLLASSAKHLRASPHRREITYI